jgi:hypothetical protein
MSIAPKMKIMMMGLPDSGKSTFVAALWQIARSPSVPEALRLGTLNGDYSYIIDLHRLWSRGKQLSRTEMGQEGIVSIPLKSRNPKSRFTDEVEIILPDLSGESFSHQWELRTMLVDYYEHLKEAAGLLVFVHSQKYNPGEMLGYHTRELEAILDEDEIEGQGADSGDESVDPMTLQAAEREITQLNNEEATTKEGHPIEVVQFQPKNVATQTKVVDLLQQAIWLTEEGHIRKVALIISAWDLVQDSIKTPLEWIESSMPLLAQYLRSNTAVF